MNAVQIASTRSNTRGRASQSERSYRAVTKNGPTVQAMATAAVADMESKRTACLELQS
jgi:hypothetical protein